MATYYFCVFGSSSTKTKDAYLDASYKVGEAIASYGHVCVNGAGRTGCMGALNEGCRSKGGHVKGVIHQMFIDMNQHDPKITDMTIFDGPDLYERKASLMMHSDCIIVLPGGVGTLDELWEAACNRSLQFYGMQTVPICILNINGYYDGSIAQMQRTADEGLLYGTIESYFHVVTDPVEAVMWSLEQLKGQTPRSHNLLDTPHEKTIITTTKTVSTFHQWCVIGLVNCVLLVAAISAKKI